MNEVDVVIVGSGQAGAPLSWRLARAGRRVVLIEKGPLGGTCVNEGCTPTKTFIASAEAAHRARTAGPLGVRTGPVTVDFERVVARKSEIVEQWRAGVEGNVAKAGDNLRLVRGTARFTGKSEIEAGGERFAAPVIILNTGARAVEPALPGLRDVPWLDNRTALDLDELPGHLLVMGGGYIGCELGQAYRRFGSEVTIIQSAPHLMPREDVDISEALEGALRDEGIRLRLGVRASAVRGAAGSVRLGLSDGSEAEGTHLLVAVGRRPNTDLLDCGRGGVELDERGNVIVDDHYRTSAQGVFAVGDCTGGPQFTHTSWDDHRILFEILNGNDARLRSNRLIPSGAFTDPQVARVGLSEREANELGIGYELASLPFGRIARAYETRRTAGLVKVLIDPATEKILGAAIVGAEAAELLGTLQMLMAAGATARTLVDAQMVHPAFAEGLQTAVMRLERYKLS